MSNVLIIGASSGIGKALARQLAVTGTTVYGTYSKTEESPTPEIKSFRSLQVLDDSIALDYLPDRLDGLVYCPGSIVLKPFARIKPEEFMQDYALQVVGAVRVIQACLPRLKNSPNSSIVLFSTVAAQLGFNFHSLVASSKGALEGLVKALAAEFAPGVRINGVAPSITNTPLAKGLLNTPEKLEANAQRHPLKRIGTPEDVANLCQFLLSEQSSWVTGQIFHVDGGLSAVRH